MTAGSLVILEGPDGVGKTTISMLLSAHMKEHFHEVLLYAFPGKEEGTIGKLIYDIHHGEVLSTPVSHPASMQLLHIAAHLDAINRIIKPAIERGALVILDRYWWSTWVYGIHDGIDHDLLDSMIMVEKKFWGSLIPTLAVVITRSSPLRPEEEYESWSRRSGLYATLATQETKLHRVFFAQNDSYAEQTVDDIVHEFIKAGIMGR